jgi:glucokinase
VAVDVGGTGIKAARFGLDGAVQQELTAATPVDRGPEAVVRAVVATAGALVAPDTLGVGLCVPGLVDAAGGVVRLAVNLGLRDVPLAREVATATGLPVAMEHDVRAATLAELRLGSGRGGGDLLCVVLGTGIAAGVVVEGRVLTGRTSSAGELGHLPVVPGGEPCSCGHRGCTEVYASAGGLVRRYRAAGGDPALGAAELAAALGSDPLAARTWAEGARALATSLVLATLLLDPARIVLAGGLSGAGDLLVDPVLAEMTSQLVWRAPPPLEVSSLGGGAGLLGAALGALDAAGRPGVADSWTT